mgnify:CR=1 FL=1
MKSKFDQYVHEYNNLWVVATYRNGTYYAPVRRLVRKITGSMATFGSLDFIAVGGAYTYKTRKAALAKARELYKQA